MKFLAKTVVFSINMVHKDLDLDLDVFTAIVLELTLGIWISVKLCRRDNTFVTTMSTGTESMFIQEFRPACTNPWNKLDTGISPPLSFSFDTPLRIKIARYYLYPQTTFTMDREWHVTPSGAQPMQCM